MDPSPVSRAKGLTVPDTCTNCVLKSSGSALPGMKLAAGSITIGVGAGRKEGGGMLGLKATSAGAARAVVVDYKTQKFFGEI